MRSPVPIGEFGEEEVEGSEREGEGIASPSNMVTWYEEIQALWTRRDSIRLGHGRAVQNNFVRGGTACVAPVR